MKEITWKPVPTRNEEEAFEMGRDCALNGANTNNCHFSLFATPGLTKAWERGTRSQKEAQRG